MQTTPVGSQRCHCRCATVVLVPDQTPSSVLSVWPTTAVPLMLGGTSEARGACGAAAVEATEAVGAEVEVADPSAFVAVTTASIVEPTSSAVTLYVVAVAPVATAPIDENAPLTESPVAGAAVIDCCTPASTVATGCEGVPWTMTR